MESRNEGKGANRDLAEHNSLGLAPDQMDSQNAKVAPRRRRFRFDELGVAAGVLVLGILLSFGSPYFLTANNLLRVGRQMTYVGILSVGMSFVIAAGQIDISVGRVITLTTFVVAKLITLGVNPWAAFIIGLGAGALCGLINGGLTLAFNVHTMIVTLATMDVFWGLAVALSNSRPIALPRNSSFFELGQGHILSVPVPLIVFVALVVAGHFVLRKAIYGRHVLAVGSNRQAAQFAGIRVKRVLLSTMVLSGLLAGLAGGVAVAEFQAFDPNLGGGMEMNTIAAAVIGGGDLNGGAASVLGSMLGAITIGLLNNGLVLLGVGAYWNNFVTGMVILIAVGIGALIRSTGRRRSSARQGLAEPSATTSRSQDGSESA